MSENRGQRHSEDQDDRVSLAGLDPEDALRALLAVDPDDEPANDAPAEGRAKPERSSES